MQEVSVVGLPDERYGEVVAAFIVKKKEHDKDVELTADQVRLWVKEKLSSHLGKSFFSHLYFSGLVFW